MGVFLKGAWIAEKFEMDLIAEGHTLTFLGKHVESTAITAGRYHLYLSKACPFAHQVYILFKLNHFSSLVSHSFVEVVRDERLGWSFSTDPQSDYYDSVNGFKYLKDLYKASEANYTGRVVVPLLWDKKKQKIVSIESIQLTKLFSRSLTCGHDFYPVNFQNEIDALVLWITDNISYAVYKTGFSFSQDAYEKQVTQLFVALDLMEKRLAMSESGFLLSFMTIADIRLFAALIRFNDIYYFHFKCSRSKIDKHHFPCLTDFISRCMAIPEIKETVDIPLIKTHYYKTHKLLNPAGIIPTTN